MLCMLVRFKMDSIEDIDMEDDLQKITSKIKYCHTPITYHISVTITPKNPFPSININPITQIKCAKWMYFIRITFNVLEYFQI